MPILRSLWSRWSDVARRIISVQTTILLTLVYFTAMLPLSLMLTFAVDILGRTPRKRSMWRKKEKNPLIFSDMRTQY